MAGFNGMRGTGDWATDQRPKNWREGIMKLWPNGTASLTALLSMAKSEATTDPEFYWWTKILQGQRATVTGVYTNAALSSAYTSGGAAGDTLYVKMSLADVANFKVSHKVLLRDDSNLNMIVRALVENRVKDGANSYIAVKLLEADDNGVTTDLSDCDSCLIIGNMNAEGAETPEAIAYDPVKYYNLTGITRTSLDITRTARLTKLRTGDAYQEAKREALELHSIELEKDFLWGIRYEDTGSNGKPRRSGDGLITHIEANSSNNFNYVSDTDFSGDAWITSGEEWFENKLEQVFRYGRSKKMAFAGSGALLGIQKLARSSGQLNLEVGQTDYGMKIVRWITPFGEIEIKTHPLFSYEVTNRNMMVVFEPENLRYRYISDTMFKKDNRDTTNGRDGTVEEWLTEAALEFHFPETAGIFKGIGLANTA